MQINPKQTFIGSGLAFILATACCWLPWLVIILGGATGLTALNQTLEKSSTLFLALGVFFLFFGGYLKISRKNKNTLKNNLILMSEITCPFCEHKHIEEMPTDACQFFYECSNCVKIIKPKEGDCCVYCSYGTVACPPIQTGESCCD